jgi:hypothetical protein
MRVISAYRKYRARKRVPDDILALAKAAYLYTREHDHPMRDSFLLTHDMERMRAARQALSHSSLEMVVK